MGMADHKTQLSRVVNLECGAGSQKQSAGQSQNTDRSPSQAHKQGLPIIQKVDRAGIEAAACEVLRSETEIM